MAETAPGERPVGIRRVVLLGFMASGKSTVGREIARMLGWSFVDLDAEIVRRAGLQVDEIFETLGEPAFRAMEVELTPRFAAMDDVVLAPGGGWVTNPGLFDSLPPDTLTVWLKASPMEILRRLSDTAGQPIRPLLAGDDPALRIENLLMKRNALYARADLVIDTDRYDVPAIAGRVVQHLHDRSRAAVEGGDDGR